ncbi:MAG: cenK, partial [Caulobacteraceae bacterium]|nr:cenK [Caulobacteraceae bacterium]
GLGLAIARELAQGHGGDLTLVDTGPQGTTFELRLPGAPGPLPA